MDHGVLKAHVFVVKRSTEVLLSHEFVPFPLSVQVLIEKTERGHIGIS